MTEILSNDNLKISVERKSKFKIEFATPSYPIIQSLIKSRIIPGANTDPSYKSFQFTAHSVKTLEQYLHTYNPSNNIQTNNTIHFAAKLIQTLSTQLQILMSINNQTILGYNPKDIIIINDTTPLYIGTEFVVEIDMNNNPETVILSQPFSRNDFFVSPELLEIESLPSSIHYKTSYFSLACVAIYVLLHGSREFYDEYLQRYKHESPQKIILNYLDNHIIKETKLYWLISRCLVEQPENRAILFI